MGTDLGWPQIDERPRCAIPIDWADMAERNRVLAIDLEASPEAKRQPGHGVQITGKGHWARFTLGGDVPGDPAVRGIVIDAVSDIAGVPIGKRSLGAVGIRIVEPEFD